MCIRDSFDPTRGEDSGFMPAFTLDLDQLFESFVAFELGKRLKEQLYSLHVQPQYPHPTIPELAGKFIMPDLVFQPRSGDTTPVVLDTKNKYSILHEGNSLAVSNADLYQISYYCSALGASSAVLVYPGNSSSATDYPFRGSEGESVYEAKRTKALNRIKSTPASHLLLKFPSQSVSLFFWRINLQGTMHETIESVAKLALFMVDLGKGRV